MYDQRLLNQGATEQVFLDYLHEMGVQVDYGTRARELTLSESNSETDHKVAVEVMSGKAQGKLFSGRDLIFRALERGLHSQMARRRFIVAI